MTEERVAHIMALVEDYAMRVGMEEYPTRKYWMAIEAALRDAPQAEQAYAYIYEWDGPFGVRQSTSSARYNGMAPHRSIPVYLAATPSAPTAGPDERAMASELIKVAAWLLSPEPTRQIDRLEDQTHIGHRQFESAQEAMRETLRNKAFEIRKFVDARAIERAVLGRGEKL
jgi:hypothetical protein